MRFLLLSDTHGKLGIINDLAADVRADAVIHAGDFGFYDSSTPSRGSRQTKFAWGEASGCPGGSAG